MKSAKKLLIVSFLSLFFFLFTGFENTASAEELPQGCVYAMLTSHGECPGSYTNRCQNPNICCQQPEQCETAPTPLPKSEVTTDICRGDDKCKECMYIGQSLTLSGKTWTALGCIPADTLNNFVGWFLGKLIFVASGIAFLLMAFGALKIITSAGSPESIQAGKELITSSLAGLVFIILSLFLLKLIGVDILQIPGFGK